MMIARCPRPILLLGASLAVAGCGSDSSATTSGGGPPAPTAPFPAPHGRSTEELVAAAGITNEIVVSPAGHAYEEGANRFSFGVFNVDGSQISDARVAIYVAHGSTGAASGPFPARAESLETEPQFEARSTASDPEAATVAYVSEVSFDRPGEWRVIAMIEQGDQPVASRLPSVEVGPYRRIPDVGDRAPRIHTPTVAGAGDIEEIETRQPPDSMHDVDLYDAYGKRPVVLLFATPALCTSRVCGPVVDIAEQVKSELGDQAAFIHQEVYVGNDPNQGPRPQLRDFGLQTEPWLFVLDGSGRVSTRIEGPFDVADLERAVRRAASSGAP